MEQTRKEMLKRQKNKRKKPFIIVAKKKRTLSNTQITRNEINIDNNMYIIIYYFTIGYDENELMQTIFGLFCSCHE